MRYRCYFLDKDGHIRGAENIEAETFEAALEEAQRLLATCAGQLSLEVWQGTSRLYPTKAGQAEP